MTSAAPNDDSTSAEREANLTPDEALTLAIELHKVGRLDDAELLYAALLEGWPDHPDVLNHMGALQQQRGNHERALALLRRAVEIAPDVPGIWNNLGNVLKLDNSLDDAERAFRRSIALADSPEARANLANVLRRRDQWSDSEAECRRALELAPEFPDAWHNLSLALMGQDRIEEAVNAANRAVVLLPPHRRQRDSYTRALVHAGELEQAIKMYREWLAHEPDNAFVRHKLAACGGEPAPERASDAYVELVFDGFAERFDAKLASLHYRAPELVTDALRQVLPPPARQFEIADIGCGTGLCGPLVAGWARRLCGCDLSRAMLELAERRAVYDTLDKAELVGFLRGHLDTFDVVVSADTLCYFGALESVADAAARAMRVAGHFVFTVEALNDDDAAPYRLLVHGRYAHRRDYLRTVLDDVGLGRQRIDSAVLRFEGGLPVRGWVVTASRE